MQDNETSKRERVIRGVGRTVTDAVVKGTDEAAAVAGNIKETIKSKTSSERPKPGQRGNGAGGQGHT